MKTEEIEDSGVIGDTWDDIFKGMRYIVDRNQLSQEDVMSITWTPEKTIIKKIK